MTDKDIIPLIDKSVLNELKSIMEDEFTDVLQVFLEDSISLMSEIHAAFNEESENRISAVEALKSCSNNVAATHLGMVARNIEENLVNGEIESARNKLDELQEVFTRSHAEIKKCMQHNLNEVA